MFEKFKGIKRGRHAITVRGLGEYSLCDTLLCGQCFRYEKITEEDGYCEYMTVVGDTLVFVGQERAGELIFYEIDDEVFESTLRPYFTLDTDYARIRRDIEDRTDSPWLMRAAECAGGIAILKQEPWETLFSFIISQNNNIPRIRGIIKRICASYGVNLSLQNNLKSCPLGKTDATPCEEICKNCGCCYTFPSAKNVYENPAPLLDARVGFRYKYLLDAAKKVYLGEIDLKKIEEKSSYEYTKTELMKILGVGEKVASCCALFGFANLEAFPIDVWMKRAIDTYFDGHLDHTSLGKYAGVAQQYIFHYIRNLEKEDAKTDKA